LKKHICYLLTKPTKAENLKVTHSAHVHSIMPFKITYLRNSRHQERISRA